MSKMLNRLLEAKIEKRAIMLPDEERLKELLIDNLRDDGNGHRHAKFAKRLEDFDVNIVPLDVDGEFTAAISFDEAVIFVSEGFLKVKLTEDQVFEQLNVLIRHELCHALLMHQIRMMHVLEQKYGNEAAEHLSVSASLHDLLNAVEDWDISNQAYSAEDKKLVKALKHSLREIPGLVTELDNAGKGWENMTVEEMYDAVEKEIAEINRLILANDAWGLETTVVDHSTMTAYKLAKLYRDVDATTSIPGTVRGLTKSPQFKEWHEYYQEIVLQLLEKYEKTTVSEQETRDMIKKIAASAPLEKVELFGGDIILYSPEEKGLAMDVIKKLSEIPEYQLPKIKIKKTSHSPEYVKAYNDTVNKYDDDSVPLEDVMEILAGVGGA